MNNRLNLDDRGRTGGRTGRRRKISGLSVVGILLLVIGIGCLGWVGYQYFGTNVVSHHAYQQEKQNLQARWEQEKKAGTTAGKSSTTAGKAGTTSGKPGTTAGKPGTTSGETGTTADKPGTSVDKNGQSAAGQGDAVALLRVPAFGEGYEVPILQGADLGTLSRGVGMYDSSVAPGQIGNFAIAGHRVTHGEPFARLLELNKGATIIVETRDAILTYVLDTAPRDLTVNEDATWVLNPVPVKGMDPGIPLITMTTCQDLFHSPDRSVAFGHLVSTKNKH